MLSQWLSLLNKCAGVTLMNKLHTGKTSLYDNFWF